jgi:lipid II:glycine glycyltransferase (peptidoglycan interpeptide bridge formation enzyme)
MSELTLSQWNAFIQSHPDAHILQTGAWGELKSRFHWEPVRIASGDTGAQVLFRALPAGLTIAYIPRGPVGQKWDRLWPEIDAVCQKKHAIFLKIEPDVWDADIKTEEKWLPKGIHPSKSIQAAQTIIIDLTPSQEEIINKMKPKTRYNIRLAEKKGVEVRFSDDIPGFHKLMAVTGERNGFGIHNQAYFQAAYDLFQSDYSCKLLMAYFENQPIAGLMVYKQGKRAWYLYGASNELERNRMPTYLLQWKAMKGAQNTISGASRIVRRMSSKPILKKSIQDCGGSTVSSEVLADESRGLPTHMTGFTNPCYIGRIRSILAFAPREKLPDGWSILE